MTQVKKIDQLNVNRISGPNRSFKLGDIDVTRDTIAGRKVGDDGEKVDAVIDGANCGKMSRSTYDFTQIASDVPFDDWDLDDNDYFIIEDHGLLNGDILQMETSTSLPAPFVTGTNYYVINSEDDFFQLSATRGGSTISFTAGSGSGSGSGGEAHTLVVNQFGDISLRTILPDNAVIMNGFLDCWSEFQSVSGTGTFTIGLVSSNDLKVATDFNLTISPPIYALIPDNTIANMIKLSSDNTVIIDVGSEQIQAGGITIFLEYVISG